MTFDEVPANIRKWLRPVEEHWIWIGAVVDESRNDKKGRIRFNGKYQYVHRLLFHLATGFDLNSELQVNHKRECITSLCCNPVCMYAGTQKENVTDSITLGNHPSVINKLRTNCPTCNSEYSISPTTRQRYCQICKNKRRDEWRIKCQSKNTEK